MTGWQSRETARPVGPPWAESGRAETRNWAANGAGVSVTVWTGGRPGVPPWEEYESV